MKEMHTQRIKMPQLLFVSCFTKPSSSVYKSKKPWDLVWKTVCQVGQDPKPKLIILQEIIYLINYVNSQIVCGKAVTWLRLKGFA